MEEIHLECALEYAYENGKNTHLLYHKRRKNAKKFFDFHDFFRTVPLIIKIVNFFMYLFIRTPIYKESLYVPHLIEHCILGCHPVNVKDFFAF